MKQRIITGAILALLVIGSIVYGNLIWPYWVNLLFAIMLFVAAQELVALTLAPGLMVKNTIAGVFVALFWWSSLFIPESLVRWQAQVGLFAWLLIAVTLPWYRHHGNWTLLVRIVLLGIGLDLLWICTHGLIHLHALSANGAMLLYLFSLVWVADIGAYFCGRRFGKHKLAPAISPGKTWEGVFGGVGLNLLWIVVVFRFSGGWGLSLPLFIGISLVTSLLSVVGDLFVSVLKREAGVKDSGRLLPGHGGVLDRIDSVIAASPVFVGGWYLASAA